MTSFHWVCLEGFSKIAKLFLDNTVDMAINLNLKDNTFLWTGFHFACYYGKTSIVDMILTNSKSLNIDITASDELGKDFSISGWNIDKRNCLFPFISYVFLNNGMIWQNYKLKVSKNRNDFMKASFLPKSNEIISALWYGGQKFGQLFSLVLGRNDVFIKSFL